MEWMVSRHQYRSPILNTGSANTLSMTDQQILSSFPLPTVLNDRNQRT